MSEENSIQLPARRGFITVSTYKGETHIEFTVMAGYHVGVLPNEYKTRKFLQTALARMEKEVANRGRKP